MKIFGYLLVLGVLAGTAFVAKTSPALFNVMVLFQVAGLGLAAMLAAYGVKRPMDALVALFAPEAKIGRGELESARRVFTGMAQLTVAGGLVVAMLAAAGAAGVMAALNLAAPAVFFGLVLGGLVCWPLALSMAVRAGDLSSARRFEYDRGQDRDRQQQPRRDQRPFSSPAAGQAAGGQKPVVSNQPQRQGGGQPPQGGQRSGGNAPANQSGQRPAGSNQPGGGEAREGRERGGRNRRNRFGRDRNDRERQPGQTPNAAAPAAATPLPVVPRAATEPAAYVAENLDEGRSNHGAAPAPAQKDAATDKAAARPAEGSSVSAQLTSTTGTEL